VPSKKAKPPSKASSKVPGKPAASKPAVGKASEKLFPHFDKMLARADKEKRLGQRGVVCWLFGLSGAGKSTLTLGLERALHKEGRIVQVLDGDNIRSGLNHDLGFGDLARRENIRRVAEVAKLFAQSGVIVLASFITPREALRELARDIIGDKDFFGVYVKASLATCTARDPKGLYKQAQAGAVKQFTGVDQEFQEPDVMRANLVLDTEKLDYPASLAKLDAALKPHYELKRKN
jgi:adenylylsulfate kinase